jgi:phospholipid transport system substrate-binding protein
MSLRFVVLSAFLFPASAFAGDAKSPKAALESAVDQVRKLLAEHAPLEAKRRQMNKLTKSLVDFSQVAEATLTSEWPKMSKKERSEFASTLEQLVEASYLNKVSEADHVDLSFGDEAGADVNATARVQGADVHLKFTLAKAGASWMVQDVEIDDVSLVRNYRAQFTKIIAKSGVKELQAKIQKKVAELKSMPDTTPTSIGSIPQR